jgi:hypothetical protein
MLSVIGDDSNRLPIISSQHPDQRRVAPGLKRNAVSDLELQHLAMRTRLVREAKALHNSVIEVNQLRFGKFVNIDLQW